MRLVQDPRTEYARSDDGVDIAFQIVGTGHMDVMFVPNWGTNVETLWQAAWALEFWERLASMGRLILCDARGTGSSDGPVLERPLTVDQAVADLRTVLAAAGSERAVQFAIESAVPLACTFAAKHPELTSQLVLYGGSASILDRGDGIGFPLSQRDVLVEHLVRGWGDADSAAMRAVAPGGSRSEDRSAMARTQRLAMRPRAVRAFAEVAVDTDVRASLPTIVAPTLVLHRTGDRLVPIAHGRHLAERIPTTQLIELPGDEHSLAFGDTTAALDLIEEFITGAPATEDPHGRSVTILFTDIVDFTTTASTLGDLRWREVLVHHDRLVRNEVRSFRGREIKSTGDGFLAEFDAAVDGVRCALSIQRTVRSLGVEVRAGLHRGRVQCIGHDIAGLAVHIGQRVCALGQANQVLVSSVVASQLDASRFGLRDRGLHDLKGVSTLGMCSRSPSHRSADGLERSPVGISTACRRSAQTAPGIAIRRCRYGLEVSSCVWSGRTRGRIGCMRRCSPACLCAETVRCGLPGGRACGTAVARAGARGRRTRSGTAGGTVSWSRAAQRSCSRCRSGGRCRRLARHAG